MHLLVSSHCLFSMSPGKIKKHQNLQKENQNQRLQKGNIGLRLVMQLIIWDKGFKNGPSKICGRQPFKGLN